MYVYNVDLNWSLQFEKTCLRYNKIFCFWTYCKYKVNVYNLDTNVVLQFNKKTVHVSTKFIAFEIIKNFKKNICSKIVDNVVGYRNQKEHYILDCNHLRSQSLNSTVANWVFLLIFRTYYYWATNKEFYYRTQFVNFKLFNIVTLLPDITDSAFEIQFQSICESGGLSFTKLSSKGVNCVLRLRYNRQLCLKPSTICNIYLTENTFILWKTYFVQVHQIIPEKKTMEYWSILQ